MVFEKIIIITGVSGSGKTTIGKLLSQKTGIPFFDADNFHPPENIQKMALGQPLTDHDRAGWLEAIHHFLENKKGQPLIFACSALKENYRKILSKNLESRTIWVFLQGDFETIQQRLEKRMGHFMPPKLLASQFEIFEPPKNAILADIHFSPKKIMHIIMKEISQHLSTNQPITNQQSTNFGLVGLGVMGKSLARNLARRGFRLSLFNRHVAGLEENVAKNFVRNWPELVEAKGFDDLERFVQSLARPRKIFIMVNAGAATDQIIENLKPLVSPGDILLDGGNAFFKDTERRATELETLGIHFLGTGVSGGEAGALNGPSIMPGGSKTAFSKTKIYLEAIAARDRRGRPCCSFVGTGGAGHFVKMVHNGIEYAEMQLLAEAYFFLRKMHGLDPGAIADIFEKWQNAAGPLASYLLEITIKILRKKTPDGRLLDQILDTAGSKGTGSWATSVAAELGQPATMISEALFARHLSVLKNERTEAGKFLKIPQPVPTNNQSPISNNQLKNALELARLINHHQGFELIKSAAKQYCWQTNLPEIARIWTSGCIIRSNLMEKLAVNFRTGDSVLLHPKFQKTILKNQKPLRQFVARGIENGLPLPCFSAAANFLNGLATENSPANLLQAQRDFFGAHSFQKVGDPSGEFYHAEWE